MRTFRGGTERSTDDKDDCILIMTMLQNAFQRFTRPFMINAQGKRDFYLCLILSLPTKLVFQYFLAFAHFHILCQSMSSAAIPFASVMIVVSSYVFPFGSFGSRAYIINITVV